MTMEGFILVALITCCHPHLSGNSGKGLERVGKVAQLENLAPQNFCFVDSVTLRAAS